MTSTYILVHQNRAIRISFTTVVTVLWFWDLFVTEKQFFNVIFFFVFDVTKFLRKVSLTLSQLIRLLEKDFDHTDSLQTCLGLTELILLNLTQSNVT